jgi:zinc protease
LVEPEGATTLNGTTDFDRTNYFQDAPVSALDLILWAEADRMGFLIKAIDQAKLDEQRGVVLNEKRQGENQPYGKVFRPLLEALFPKGHPYSWEVIGLSEDLEAASLKDVHQWFTNYYAPNAFICIAGDITPEAAKEKVENISVAYPQVLPCRGRASGSHAQRGKAHCYARSRQAAGDLPGVGNSPSGHGRKRLANPGGRDP